MLVERRLIAGRAVGAALVSILIFASAASAERRHIVLPGQSLAVIAKRYKVDVASLASANGLNEDQTLHDGQVLTVPPQGVVFVMSGQTLSSIAHEHGVPLAELIRHNHLDEHATLHIGQQLVLPGYKATASAPSSKSPYGVPKQRGFVSLYRIWSRENRRLRLVDAHGRVSPVAQRSLREFLRPRESKRRKLPNARLLSLLAQVSDHYGGRRIDVVSGYRLPGGFTRPTSRHVAGEAIDFRIPGIALTELRDYCSHFANVGVGYYPRSQFVHLDVRRTPARWTDWSLPGQGPILQKPADLEEADTDGARGPQPKSEADIPEAPPAPDDGQPPLEPDQPARRPAVE